MTWLTMKVTLSKTVEIRSGNLWLNINFIAKKKKKRWRFQNCLQEDVSLLEMLLEQSFSWFWKISLIWKSVYV